MSHLRNLRRFADGHNSMFDGRKHNNRKSTRGRVNQYIDIKDKETGKQTRRQKLIRHYR